MYLACTANVPPNLPFCFFPLFGMNSFSFFLFPAAKLLRKSIELLHFSWHVHILWIILTSLLPSFFSDQTRFLRAASAQHREKDFFSITYQDHAMVIGCGLYHCKKKYWNSHNMSKICNFPVHLSFGKISALLWFHSVKVRTGLLCGNFSFV